MVFGPFCGPLAHIGLVGALVGAACTSSVDVLPAGPADGVGGAVGGGAGTAAETGAGGEGGETFGAGGEGGATASSVVLVGAPLVIAPTPDSFGVSVALADGDPSVLRARVRPEGQQSYRRSLAAETPAPDLAEWRFEELEPGTSYEYQVIDASSGAVVSTGSAVTARPPGEPFRFALLSDTHIGSDLSYTNQGDENVMAAVSAEIGSAAPDFMVHLGDMLDYHQYGFNSPPPDTSISRLAYLNFRAQYGDTGANTAHFPVIGNWEGENGSYTEEEIQRSRTERMLYVPGPTPATYPEGGGAGEDYYAFTWGDALCVVLNVMTYTPTAHLLSTSPGLPDDWTLGSVQLAWLRKTLENATSKWRFLFIHHTVGGMAGNDANSAYGRGGGQAAYVGEQAIVHELMLEHGVQIFFYGHDHVFVDMAVDGIHYTDPGNAGAIWTFTTSETGYIDYWGDSGWAKVDVTPDDVHVSFMALGGTVLHEYTVTQ